MRFTPSPPRPHDAWNRLVKQEVDGEGDPQTVGEYQYNGLHWRVVKTAPGLGVDTPQRREMIYSAAWQLLEERIDDDYGSGEDVDRIGQQFWGARYIDDPVARRLYDTGTSLDSLFFHLTDAQFSTVAMVQPSYQSLLQERVRYRPYGAAEHRFPSDLDDDGINGETADEDLFDDAYGADIGDAEYNADADIFRDGTIDTIDAALFAYWSSKASVAPGRISDSLHSASALAPDNPIGYDGYVFNSESNLYTVRFRWYDPALGRWLERDPAAYRDGMNAFEYVRSTCTLVDPLGLESCSSCDKGKSKIRGGQLSFTLAGVHPEEQEEILKKAEKLDQLATILSGALTIAKGDIFDALWTASNNQTLAIYINVALVAQMKTGGMNIWIRVTKEKCECGTLSFIFGCKWKVLDEEWVKCSDGNAHDDVFFFQTIVDDPSVITSCREDTLNNGNDVFEPIPGEPDLEVDQSLFPEEEGEPPPPPANVDNCGENCSAGSKGGSPSTP